MRRRLGRRRICRLAGLRIRGMGIASREKRRWIFTASGRRFTSTPATVCSARKSTTQNRAEKKGEHIPRTASRAPKNQGRTKSARDFARDDSLKTRGQNKGQ